MRATAPGAYRYVLSKGALECQTASYGLCADAAVRFYASDGVHYTLSPPARSGVWDGGWHTVRGGYDGARVSLWVDGIKVGTRPATFRIGDDLPQTGPCSSGRTSVRVRHRWASSATSTASR